MAQVVKETPTSSQIPQFVPFGELYYAQDTGDLWIGTGFSAGSDFTPGNPGPNVNIELVSSPGGSPGGFSGDIQYNKGGVLGGSAATVDALGNIVALTLTSTTVTSTAFDFLGVLVDTTGTVGASGQFLETTSTGVKWATVAAGGSTWAALTGDMTSTQVAPWDGPTPGTPDTGFSRIAAATIGVGNGTAGDVSGLLQIGAGAYNAPALILGGSTGVTQTTGLAYVTVSGGKGGIQLCASGDLLQQVDYTFGTTILATGALGFSASATSAVTKSVVISPTGTPNVLAIGASASSQNGTWIAGLYSFGSVYGTPDTGLSRVSAGILGIGTGASGSIAGNIQCSSIALNGAVSSPSAGVYYSGTAAGVTQAAEAVGTIATTGGIVTTFTAVSDERLKVSTAYLGGLEEILGITPIRYRWNAKGAELSGQTGDRDYVGFSAQNVEKSIPEAIQSKKGPEQYLSFDDRPVIAALTNAVKELAARVKQLEATA